MSRPIRIFVNSSPDLAPEREALGQAVAELPVSIGTQIKHTPRWGEDEGEALAFLQGCDLYVLVLGADFAAPMGLEWRTALGAATPALAYRRRVLHSPSAEKLRREWAVAWTEFDSPQELKAHATQALARMLLDRGEEFGLHLEDVEGLVELVQREEAETPAEPDRRRGAGRDAVILGHAGTRD